MAQGRQTEGLRLLDRARGVHFVGIGGIGMSALAELLLRRGKLVSGSDVRSSSLTERLASAGARINIGHSADAVIGADLVVATSAAGGDNPELVEAHRRGIPVIKRAELLGWLMSDSLGIAIAGTHGKTTTTGMVAYLLDRAGLEPTALIGGESLNFPSHGLLGKGPYLVAEADEFDRSFLQMWPRVAIITSVEADHLDCYVDLEDIARTFREFASRIPPEGLLVTCADDPVLKGMDVPVPRESYGLDSGSDWRILEDGPTEGFGTQFRFLSPSGLEHECRLQLPGRHYALNALAAIAVAGHLGIDPRASAGILEGFRGTRRRFEMVGTAGGVKVVDDYAHHPTAVQGTLGAARERHEGDIWCVFQPHTANRTQHLAKQFAAAFADANHVLMLPIYQPAGREEGAEISSRDVVALMKHPDVRIVDGLTEAAALLVSELKPGDLVITMGAGDVVQVGPLLLDRLGASSVG